MSIEQEQNHLVPDWGELGVPIIDDAEPENAGVDHSVPPEELE